MMMTCTTAGNDPRRKIDDYRSGAKCPAIFHGGDCMGINRDGEIEAYKKMISAGMTPAGACGLIGNLEAESAGFTRTVWNSCAIPE